ncbi:MAG: hypothetical protein R3A52_30840 [Polyangiales bacterium]
MRSRHALTLAVILAAATPTVALAQTNEVEAEHQRGMQLRARGRDAEAAEVFRELFARTGEPRALARLGLAEGALLRWADAEEHLQGALDRAADPWVIANRGSLEDVLRSVRQHLGAVTVTCPTPGATVQWTGQSPVALPLARPLRVPTGFLDVVVHAPGHAPVTRRVAVTAGTEPVAVEVTLSRETGAETTAPTAVASPSRSPVSSTPRAVTAHTPPPEGRAWLRPLGVGLSIGAGVSLGLGVLGVVLREGAASRFNEGRCRLYPDRDEVSSGGPACADELSNVQTGQAIAITGFVAAGVLGVAGVTALLLAPRAPVRVDAGPTADGRGWAGSVSLRF